MHSFSQFQTLSRDEKIERTFLVMSLIVELFEHDMVGWTTQ